MLNITVRQVKAKTWHVEINGAVDFITHRGRKGALQHADFCINRAKIQNGNRPLENVTLNIIPL